MSGGGSQLLTRYWIEFDHDGGSPGVCGVTVAMLDAFHVVPAMLPPHARGVWYPPVGGA